MPEEAPIVELLVAFGQELREAGLAAGTGDVMTCCAAVATLDPSDLADLYWAGRTTMVTRRDQIPVYRPRVRRFFLDERDARSDAETLKLTIRAATPAQSVLEIPATEPGESGDEEEVSLGLMASDTEVRRDKSFAACTPEELAALRRIMAPDPPHAAPPLHPADGAGAPRHPARHAADGPGDHAHARRAVRAVRRRRRQRMRPLVLILDISGSMSDYSRNLLQFAHSTSRAAARVEVFCFGTHLTRITKALERRRADDALDEAAKAVVDWEGGTRIGDSLDALFGGGAGGAPAGAPSWSSAPTASTVVIQPCWPGRWSGSGASATASSG